MFDRRVTHIRTNDEENIIALANPETWGSVSIIAVKLHIQNNMYHYYVMEEDYVSYIKIIHKEGRTFLTTGEDPDSANNLNNLPAI